MSGSLFDLTGRVALITGGHKGLGRGITNALAEAGADIVVVSRHVTDAFLDEMKQYGVVCRKYNYDISELDEQKKLVDNIIRDFGTIDILVNNAGFQFRCPAEDFPVEKWDQVVNINCRASYFMCQRVGKIMLEKGYGKIINIASINTFQGRKFISAYAASKGAIGSFTKSMANEWAARGVNVNCLMPGFVATDLTRDLFQDPKAREEVLSRIPMGRMGEPSDLGGAAVFLASRASDYITGHVLCVDGGWMGA
ncbi:MAG: glucose 1-dehydrogenase [Oscillibacter sp.]|jgi:2-deoxy-D-gluconate 3-dehydrogenase|nr:glucose 1-dehydrogenase [Oscillibacter sp.]